ncbi:MAG: hypothetical protein PHI12_06495 [Dehalococcoidales bacterium]|nr:hypothetical protein [Dehalococcoidales bacterium]
MDIQNLVEESAQVLDREFLRECEQHVRKEYCEHQYCDRFPCDVVQHNVRMLRLCTWAKYVKLN